MKATILLLLVALLLLPAAGNAQIWQSNPFSCTITSTAVVLTQVTGCAVLTTGQRRYVTDIVWSSSIISTTTNFMTVQYGTGTNCATGTATMFVDFLTPAYASRAATFQTPLITGVNGAICFLHPGAGTRNITVNGFLLP